MITVAVVAILSAIAYPSYQEYVLRSRRVEAQSLLGEAAARQERWRAQNGGHTNPLAHPRTPRGDKAQKRPHTPTKAPAAQEGGQEPERAGWGKKGELRG